MNAESIANKYLFTNEAKCQDCYRCVRVCPVKAVGIKHNQAFVDESRCILCGKCIKECPQQAKYFRDDVEHVRELIRENSKVAVAIAPSFASVYSDWESERIPSALRKLGFSSVYNTSEGAFYVANGTKDFINESESKTHLCSSCPSFVSYIEKYEPKIVNKLVPIVSPMIAESMIIKQKYGIDTKVVFIGPCIAKKKEAERRENRGYIDAVLTYKELERWLNEEEIKLDRLEASGFDNSPLGYSTLFPISGGLFQTGEFKWNSFSETQIAVTGIEEISEALKYSKENPETIIIEPLICSMGCINGPGVDSEKNLFERKSNLSKYSAKYSKETEENAELVFKTKFLSDKEYMKVIEHREEEIKAVLEKTGKYALEDELNCGACGYPSCRAKAIAVLEGMAEINMCMPYMRRMAQQRADKIIDQSPNGIVILDEYLNILNMNDSFKKFFMCTDSVYGKNISYLIDPEDFEKLAAGEIDLIEITMNHEKYNIITHQKMFKMKEDKQYVGIFVDMTKNMSDKKQLDKLKSDTLSKAEELLDHQITMAQNLAKFLGESTAKGEELLENLIKLTEDEQRKTNQKNKWLWDMYTSK